MDNNLWEIHVPSVEYHRLHAMDVGDTFVYEKDIVKYELWEKCLIEQFPEIVLYISESWPKTLTKSREVQQSVVIVRVECHGEDIDEILGVTCEIFGINTVYAYKISDKMRMYAKAIDVDELSWVAEARLHKREVEPGGELFITQSGAKEGMYYLQARYFYAVEVEWRTKMSLNREQAEDIIRAGIASAWFNCIEVF